MRKPFTVQYINRHTLVWLGYNSKDVSRLTDHDMREIANLLYIHCMPASLASLKHVCDRIYKLPKVAKTA
jgi:hypothetical protein